MVGTHDIALGKLAEAVAGEFPYVLLTVNGLCQRADSGKVAKSTHTGIGTLVTSPVGLSSPLCPSIRKLTIESES